MSNAGVARVLLIFNFRIKTTKSIYCIEREFHGVAPLSTFSFMLISFSELDELDYTFVLILCLLCPVCVRSR